MGHLGDLYAIDAHGESPFKLQCMHAQHFALMENLSMSECHQQITKVFIYEKGSLETQDITCTIEKGTCTTNLPNTVHEGYIIPT